MSRGIANPAAHHSDPTVREAFGVLFRLVNEGMPVNFGDRFKVRAHRTPDGKEVLLVRRRATGTTWATVMAVDEAGKLYTGSAAEASVDFDAKGWNPSEE